MENKDASKEELEKGFEALSSELQKIGAELYKNVQADAAKGAEGAAGASGGSAGATGKKGETVEGEIVDEGKKD